VRAGWMRLAAAGAVTIVLGACGRGEPGSADTAVAAAATRPDSVPPAAGPATSGETSTLPHTSPSVAGAFRLAGNEPFWGVRITEEGLRYSSPDYKDGLLFPSTAPESSGGRLRWVALLPPPEAHTLEVVIEERRCQDTMADRIWTHVATVVFDGTTLSGCGERIRR